MGIAAKLGEWESLGLIDAEQADAIRAHEQAHARPLVLWSVVSLGLLALALGIISLVAANWDDIPDAVKLSLHLVLTAVAAVALIVFDRRGAHLAAEGALFLLAACTLAGIALHAQVFQLSGPLWQALALWAVLMSPVILGTGSGWLTGIGLAAMWVALAGSYLFDRTHWVGESLALAVPPMLMLASLAVPATDRSAPFRSILMTIGIGLTLIAASAAHVFWVDSVDLRRSGQVLVRLSIVAVVGGAVAVLAWRRQSSDARLMIVTIISASLLAVALAAGMPHGGGIGARMIGLISFLAYWAAIAAAADRTGWHQLFGVAIAAIAVRLFIIYFELFYSLATTGVGLIVAGVLLIALAWGWVRVVRRAAA